MFAISGANLPCVRSYQDAEHVWTNAYRHSRFGHPDHERGLASLRDTSKRIEKQGDEYHFVYHHTPLVIWAPTELRVETHDSQSSVTFSNCFLPSCMSARTHHGEMYIQWGGGSYQPCESDMVFNLVDSKWVLDESTVAKIEVYVTDLKAAAAVRKKLRPFREHRDGLLRLRHGEHRATSQSERDMCEVLETVLAYKALDQDAINSLAAYIPAYDDTILLRNAYLIGGAVKWKAIAGVVREWNSPYASRVGRNYL